MSDREVRVEISDLRPIGSFKKLRYDNRIESVPKSSVKRLAFGEVEAHPMTALRSAKARQRIDVSPPRRRHVWFKTADIVGEAPFDAVKQCCLSGSGRA